MSPLQVHHVDVAGGRGPARHPAAMAALAAMLKAGMPPPSHRPLRSAGGVLISVVPSVLVGDDRVSGPVGVVDPQDPVGIDNDGVGVDRLIANLLCGILPVLGERDIPGPIPADNRITESFDLEDRRLLIDKVTEIFKVVETLVMSRAKRVALEPGTAEVFGDDSLQSLEIARLKGDQVLVEYELHFAGHGGVSAVIVCLGDHGYPEAIDVGFKNSDYNVLAAGSTRRHIGV